MFPGGVGGCTQIRILMDSQARLVCLFLPMQLKKSPITGIFILSLFRKMHLHFYTELILDRMMDRKALVNMWMGEQADMTAMVLFIRLSAPIVRIIV